MRAYDLEERMMLEEFLPVRATEKNSNVHIKIATAGYLVGLACGAGAMYFGMNLWNKGNDNRDERVVKFSIGTAEYSSNATAGDPALETVGQLSCREMLNNRMDSFGIYSLCNTYFQQACYVLLGVNATNFDMLSSCVNERIENAISSVRGACNATEFLGRVFHERMTITDVGSQNGLQQNENTDFVADVERAAPKCN